MEKKNKVVKKKEIKLNVSYLLFIKDLINSKLEIGEKNKSEIENKYSEIVNLRFNNIKRVDKRVNRKENIIKLNSFLEKEKIDKKLFREVSKKVVEISNKRVSNYI